ncbi:sll0787 family AIR synthase-like protein [Pseudanabaena yagii]|uniref:Sll0787 family AIR synthase-like protein n=1 Tax=Pseudanabaena yagii GIHE-NHR1 TaxID=2722753 RepID=A0ABX1LWD3_9CYAN|nr:sll0787 family AIR synthase-like protein [Pseudanabaena yagii]NMF59094.1 sll0787 family AIR synthase-like protein [Pseudanabaena yagii GIHE-NHR1]
MLSELVKRLQRSLSLPQKQDIQTAAKALYRARQADIWQSDRVLIGDDCAAIPDSDGYLLLASEGMLPQLIETDPWFAGWCAVMVNVSDIYAMGGVPIAVVDSIWSQTREQTAPIWEGMCAASLAYQVPIVGGHTNCHSIYNALSVAILGRAHHLISSFKAQPNDLLLIATDFRGQCHSDYAFWNAATTAEPERLRQNLAILPRLAANGWCDAGKDISMGGIVGTLLMLLETSKCGAILDLDRVPCPDSLSLEKWLTSFPSYGFLLSIRPEHLANVQAEFEQQDLVCAVIGEVQANTQLILRSQGESCLFWDFKHEALTGF